MEQMKRKIKLIQIKTVRNLQRNKELQKNKNKKNRNKKKKKKKKKKHKNDYFLCFSNSRLNKSNIIY